MRDAHSVINYAVNGHAKELAKEYEVSLSRMYELLSTDCPYPKAKRMIRKIGRINPEGVRLIKADMDALFEEILGDDRATLAEFHKECFEAVQADLENKPIVEQIKETRDVVAIGTKRIANLTRCLAPAEDQKKFEEYRRNGGKQ